ncbi:helix-turn-helix domain-containing protein [Actinacidiphila alni]|nr:helix-turn-helix domain-containing protein [Actinacidiphila alni]
MSGADGTGGHGMGRGVLRPDLAAGRVELRQRAPRPELAPLVEFYWNPRWDLRGRPDHEQKVLAHPNVHLVFEEPGPLVYGVQRGVFNRVLSGRGQVLGVKFRPGAFRPFIDGPVADLADRAVPAAELLGPDAGPGLAALNREILVLDDLTAMTALAEDHLLGLLRSARPDPLVAEVTELVERITASPQLFRVDELARELDMPVRRLQRLFAEYVGASPKWVLRRARLHEAAARADGGADIDWAALAADLGYADQAHLTRDFTAAVGAPPSRYASR